MNDHEKQLARKRRRRWLRNPEHRELDRIAARNRYHRRKAALKRATAEQHELPL